MARTSSHRLVTPMQRQTAHSTAATLAWILTRPPLDRALETIFRFPRALIVVVAVIGISLIVRDLHRLGEAGSESGSLLASNTIGAILGSLVIPFLLMPTIGSPAIIVVLALANATLGICLAILAGRRTRWVAAAGAVMIVVTAVLALGPATLVQPNVALIESLGRGVGSPTPLFDEAARFFRGAVEEGRAREDSSAVYSWLAEQPAHGSAA